MSKVEQENLTKSRRISAWTKFFISALGFLITVAYFPLELGFGLIRTSIPIVALAGIMVAFTHTFQKFDLIDVILLLLSCWITIVLVIIPSLSSSGVNWNLYLGEAGSLAAGGLIRKLCREFSRELIRGLGYGLFTQVFLGLYQVVMGPRRLNGLGYVYPTFIFEPGGGFSRAFGSFFNPVVYGSFIAILGIGLCSFYINEKKKFIFIAIAALAAIILSETRGALIAFLIGIILLAIKMKKITRDFPVILSIYILTIGLLFLSLFVHKSDFLERNTNRIISIKDATSDQSVLTRQEMWKEASQLIAENPITGGGTEFLLGDFEYSTPFLQAYKHPHSTYFFVALVYGVFPGLFLFLLLLLKLVTLKNEKSVIIVFIIAGATETIWSSVNMMILLILLSEITEQK